MSQVDNRNSSAAKRARTDGGRREDDWTCPSCGNVNFSFRTTCNMRNCTQPRPADHSFSAPKSLPTPQGYSSAASPMYVGLPPYGSSLLNGSTVPPYDVGSAYRYNYGTHVSGGSPYRPLQIPASPPYSGGSLIGGMYGVPQLMNRYGLGLPMGYTAMAPQLGFIPEEKGRKKDGKGDNDWICPNCGNNNFSFRTVCNMRKCNTPKTGSQAGSASKSFKPDMPDGSWKCEQCNNINYAFRTKCNRQNCGAEKPSDSEKPPAEEAAEENAQYTRTCLRRSSSWSESRSVGLVMVVMLLQLSSYSRMVCVVSLYFHWSLYIVLLICIW
ncbi:putative Zinc finger, RanBP2-type [Helianthus annuus]|nr:putative Zinc finger, RanBP2-type [Helianthus annuus]